MMTMFPAMNIQLAPDAFMPAYAHDTDAGADLFTPVDFTLNPWEPLFIDTGVHIELGDSMKAEIVPKSGLYRDYRIITFGLIDQGYSGPIGVTLYKLGGKPHHFERGDKITQLVISPVLHPRFTQVEQIGAGPRGTGGFGSTGVRL